MERRALIMILWLMSASASGVVIKGTRRIITKPMKGVQRVYRNVPQGVYASAYAKAAPYGAFSFNVPVAVPATKAKKNVKPVKRDTDNFNGYITDSYGKPATQFDAFKAAFLQQLAQLQQQSQLQPLQSQLQPLAAPSYQFPQGLPAWPWANQQQPIQFGKPLVGSFVPGDVEKFNSLSDQFQFGAPAQLTQDSKTNLYYAGQDFNWIQNEPKQQSAEQQEPDQNEYYFEEPQQFQAPNFMAKVQTPIRHTVRTNQNGKDVVVQIDTKPPLPLVDLRALEPLKFPNGIQLQ